jgi:hypothetical protein
MAAVTGAGVAVRVGVAVAVGVEAPDHGGVPHPEMSDPTAMASARAVVVRRAKLLTAMIPLFNPRTPTPDPVYGSTPDRVP